MLILNDINIIILQVQITYFFCVYIITYKI